MKKGFTLAELLAVLILISIIAIVSIPVVINTIKTYKKTLCEKSLDELIVAAQNWAASNRNLMPSNNPTLELCGNNDTDFCISVPDLIDEGFLDEDTVNPKTKQPFSNNLVVRITKEDKKYYYNLYDLETKKMIDYSSDEYCGYKE